MSNIFSKSFIISAVVNAISMLAVGMTNAHATTSAASTCVDGSKRANFSVTWNTNGNVSVHTIGNKQLCADTTLFFSSYTMPDNYNGLPFANNPTASPQSIFDNTSAVLKKGTDGTHAFSIKLPEACKNIQVDLYYAPQITTVTSAGHGAQYITGKIINKTVDECTPTTPETPITPEVPVPEAQTPPTPTPEVEVVTPAPVSPVSVTPEALPHTGTSFTDILAGSAVISAVTYAAVYVMNKRR